MAKDPAFLFYYDRFLSGTISMTDEEVGQYIRLMCIQANKGHVSKKDMLHICKTLDNEVCLKFAPKDGHYVNLVLEEICQQRRNFSESRRNNRKGGKKETNEQLVNNTSETYVSHMVNVNKDVNVDIDIIEDNLKNALNEIYIDQQKSKWPHLNFTLELNSFKEKVRGSPEHYKNHDTGGLRLAFQSQLRNAKHKSNGKSKGFDAEATIRNIYGTD